MRHRMDFSFVSPHPVSAARLQVACATDRYKMFSHRTQHSSGRQGFPAALPPLGASKAGTRVPRGGCGDPEILHGNKGPPLPLSPQFPGTTQTPPGMCCARGCTCTAALGDPHDPNEHPQARGSPAHSAAPHKDIGTSTRSPFGMGIQEIAEITKAMKWLRCSGGKEPPKSSVPALHGQKQHKSPILVPAAMRLRGAAAAVLL